MPLSHTRAFRVRYDECDAYGHVNNAVYLRYMQETAFDASAAAGFGLDRYTALGRLWLAHTTHIEYVQPLVYGDTVAVTTWVADFARVRSRRQYELRRAADGALAAHAYTDWVFVDAATHRPAAIPPELPAVFRPEGGPTLKRTPAPVPPPPPAGVFRWRRRVEWRDVDTVGMVNNPNYLAYVGEVSFLVCQAFGWPHSRMAAAGFGVLVHRHHLLHQQAAAYGDELEIATWAYAMRAASGIRHFRVTRPADGAPIAEVNTEYAWVDLKTHRPIRIPRQFLADFAPNLVTEPAHGR